MYLGTATADSKVSEHKASSHTQFWKIQRATEDTLMLRQKTAASMKLSLMKSKLQKEQHDHK